MPFLEIASLGSALFGAALSMAAQDGDTSCAALDSYTPPAVGIGEDGRALNITTLNRITENDGAETHWVRQSISSIDIAGERLFPPRLQRSLAALFTLESGPSEGEDGLRRYAYSDDMLEILVGLEPGESAMSQRAETSAMGNRTRTIRGPFTMRFYHVVSDARSYMPGRRPEADTTLTTPRTIALSTRYGWPLQTDTGEYIIRAISVTGPERAGDAAGE